MGLTFAPQGSHDAGARADIETLRKQISDLVTPTSKTPEKLMVLFDALVIHPRIREASKRLFSDQYYAEAIFAAYKKIEIMVKEKSEVRGLVGHKLMGKVFDKDNPILLLNDAKSDGDIDEQLGFMHIFMGVMTGIRNPKGHEDIVQKDPVRTIQYLAFASLLAQRVDEARKA